MFLFYDHFMLTLIVFVLMFGELIWNKIAYVCRSGYLYILGVSFNPFKNIENS